jgi:hypothetical protein
LTKFSSTKNVLEGLSTAQIAAQIFSSKDSVQKGLRLAGIPARVSHQPHGRQSQPRYGQKRVDGKVAEHKTEQRVINAVRKMRANGLTLRAIASCLGEMKIPRPSVGGRSGIRRWLSESLNRVSEPLRAPIMRLKKFNGISSEDKLCFFLRT